MRGWADINSQHPAKERKPTQTSGPAGVEKHNPGLVCKQTDDLRQRGVGMGRRLAAQAQETVWARAVEGLYRE